MCTSARRQISKLLKALIRKGKTACKELFRIIEVDLKREDLIQEMKNRSADMRKGIYPQTHPPTHIYIR